MREMEEEAEKLKEMQNAVDLKMNMSSPTLCKYNVWIKLHCSVKICKKVGYLK